MSTDMRGSEASLGEFEAFLREGRLVGGRSELPLDPCEGHALDEVALGHEEGGDDGQGHEA